MFSSFLLFASKAEASALIFLAFPAPGCSALLLVLAWSEGLPVGSPSLLRQPTAALVPLPSLLSHVLSGAERGGRVSGDLGSEAQACPGQNPLMCFLL